jgi:hypothetical protein
MTPALTAALTAIAAARQILRARTPGTPAGDKDEEHEQNTYGLPEGAPIRKAFKRFAKRQLKQTLSSLPVIGAPLPTHFPSVAKWNDPMASAMTPLVGLYWDDAGQTTRARLGLDPDRWEVHDPHLHQMIQQQAFRFCESTNETTDKELGAALEDLRQQFIEGLVDAGDTIPQLTRRVQSVFGRLSNSRAEMIARTEAARAVHLASLVSAKESGVVSGKKWLLSADACDRCHAAAAKYPAGVGLDLPFADDGKGGDYSSCPAPPLHPNCRCSITFVCTDEYEKLLAEFGPPEPESFDYQGGSLGPEPKRRKIAKPGKRKPPELDLSELENLKPPPKKDAVGNTVHVIQPLSPAEHIPTRESFPNQVYQAAERVPKELLVGDSKAWIHHVHGMHQTEGQNPRMTLPQFKEHLLDHRAEIQLARADLVQAFSQADLRASDTELKEGDRVMAVFNFVKIPKSKS